MSDTLERLLRHDARRELADEGFTLRVMGAIPAAVPHARPWLKPVLVMGSATLGSVLAATLSPQGASLFQGFQDLVRLHASSPAAITALAICGALFVSGLVLATDSE
jgi:hypothetical protein